MHTRLTINSSRIKEALFFLLPSVQFEPVLTTNTFLLQEELKKLPAPKIAESYYTGGDLYLFDEFQSSREPNTRRPKIDNLYDVFMNIRDDEAEHCKTMKACQTHGSLRSPHGKLCDESEDYPGCPVPQTDCVGIVDCIKKSVADPQVSRR